MNLHYFSAFPHTQTIRLASDTNILEVLAIVILVPNHTRVVSSVLIIANANKEVVQVERAREPPWNAGIVPTSL
jgi:hypothetical protein